MGEISRISEPPPVLREPLASLYTRELEMVLIYIPKKKKGHKNNVGCRKQNSLYKNVGVGEGHGAGQSYCKASCRRRSGWPSRPQALH